MVYLSQLFQRALAEQRAGRPISTEAVLAAGQAATFLYPVIFGQGSIVASILSRITSRHCSTLQTMLTDPGTPAEARGSLRALLAWEAGVRYRAAGEDRHSAIHCALWIHRVLDFIQCYLTIMCSAEGIPPSVCARAAYDAKLAPYHGASLSR